MPSGLMNFLLPVAVVGLLFGVPIYRWAVNRFGGPRWLDYEAFRLGSSYSVELIAAVCRSQGFKLKFRTAGHRVVIHRASANHLAAAIRKMRRGDIQKDDAQLGRDLFVAALGLVGGNALSKQKNAVNLKSVPGEDAVSSLKIIVETVQSPGMKGVYFRYDDLLGLLEQRGLSLALVNATLSDPSFELEWEYLGTGHKVDDDTKVFAIDALSRIAAGEAVDQYTATVGLAALEGVFGGVPAPQQQAGSPAVPQARGAPVVDASAAPSPPPFDAARSTKGGSGTSDQR